MVHRKMMAALAAGLLCFSFSSYANEGPDAPKDAAVPFTAAVKENGKWGAVDGSGHTVIPISYDKVGISLSDPDVKEEMWTVSPAGTGLWKWSRRGFAVFTAARERW